MQPDYFEVLPLHPPPQPLESLTSFLTRLAEANGIPTLYRLQPILFPGRHADSIREMKDLPPSSFDSLSTAALCPEAALRATTFHPLIKKFGRPTNSVAVAQFLLGHLAPQLRYCPLCLQTDPPTTSSPGALSSLTVVLYIAVGSWIVVLAADTSSLF